MSLARSTPAALRPAALAGFLLSALVDPISAGPLLLGRAMPLHSTNAHGIEFQSDFDVPNLDALALELATLRRQVEQRLDLESTRTPLRVLIFRSMTSLSRFVRANHPDLIEALRDRSAVFEARGGTQRIFTYYSRTVITDLRHEIVHAALHDAGLRVPLWLDEGLAEYFEPREIGRQPGYERRLARRLGRGWAPNLERLEKIDTMEAFSVDDYAEAWLWVAWALSEPVERQAVLDYLKDLRFGEPTALSRRFNEQGLNAGRRCAEHLRSLAVHDVGWQRRIAAPVTIGASN